MVKFRVAPAFRHRKNIGMGLFANQAFVSGEVVVQMNPEKLVQMSESKWQKEFAVRELPHDGAVYLTRLRKRISDWPRGKTGRWAMPRWYRLNHSTHPNLAMQYNYSTDHHGNRRKTVQWVATKPIHKGTELTFNYGEATEQWDV